VFSVAHQSIVDGLVLRSLIVAQEKIERKVASAETTRKKVELCHWGHVGSPFWPFVSVPGLGHH
jgi:hypothetical protein